MFFGDRSLLRKCTRKLLSPLANFLMDVAIRSKEEEIEEVMDKIQALQAAQMVDEEEGDVSTFREITNIYRDDETGCYLFEVNGNMAAVFEIEWLYDNSEMLYDIMYFVETGDSEELDLVDIEAIKDSGEYVLIQTTATDIRQQAREYRQRVGH